MPGVEGHLICDVMESGEFIADMTEAAQAAADGAQPGDIILTIGAGDVTELGAVILDRISDR